MCGWRQRVGKQALSTAFLWLCYCYPGWSNAALFPSYLHIFVLRNALAIALFLEKHEAVTKVLYPGLSSHPQHAIAKKQQHGFGAMVTFYCVGGRPQSASVLQNVRVSMAERAPPPTLC